MNHSLSRTIPDNMKQPAAIAKCRIQSPPPYIRCPIPAYWRVPATIWSTPNNGITTLQTQLTRPVRAIQYRSGLSQAVWDENVSSPRNIPDTINERNPAHIHF